MLVINPRILLQLVAVEIVVSLNAVKESNVNFTEHWLSKHKAVFDIFDVNKDGVVTKEEHIDLTTERAKRVLEPWRAKAVYGIMSDSYKTWWSNKDTNYATSITFEELIPALEKEVQYTREAIIQNCWDWFHTFDLDCDEKLTVDEYSKFLTVFRNTAPVQNVFKAIDRDGNGVINGEKFLYGFQHTWYDTKASSADFILGAHH
ncbi:calmodulin-like protein 1 [Lingula anatina]|uniref:Calmodulin-like protein 1 n=1 Tax=Lingula anatina TaxID=7574 RepID=A0A1S3JFM2_LINAN|nr:calmodulin-like protein 1 [Lingula anatina]|eukprot:XP_013409153.1 calmodulin-like protein 1 [Lingula anatina]